jgi:hypothetical protein
MSQWNTLSVRLENGWQCTLVLATEYSSPSGNWLPFTKGDEREQIEQDRRDFDWHFRPRSDLRTVSGETELHEIQSFLRDTLNVVHWNQPTDNAGVRRALRNIVASGRLVPVVNREWRALGRVARPAPAPLRWPSCGGGFGGGSQRWAAFANASPGPLTLNGEPVLSGPYDPVTQESQLIAARANVSTSGTVGDPLGLLEAVAGAVLGIDYGADDGVDELTENSGDTSTPLGNAQPFEYVPNTPVGDSFEIAKTPNEGEPGTWYTNPGSGQMRMFGIDGQRVVDFDCDHDHGQGVPHAHNWAIDPLGGKLSRGPPPRVRILVAPIQSINRGR